MQQYPPLYIIFTTAIRIKIKLVLKIIIIAINNDINYFIIFIMKDENKFPLKN